MKPNEAELRAERERGKPFTIITGSGDRIKVRSADHIFFPPQEDEDGGILVDRFRSDFFEVWSDGQRKRLVAFQAVQLIETVQ